MLESRQSNWDQEQTEEKRVCGSAWWWVVLKLKCHPLMVLSTCSQIAPKVGVQIGLASSSGDSPASPLALPELFPAKAQQLIKANTQEMSGGWKKKSCFIQEANSLGRRWTGVQSNSEDSAQQKVFKGRIVWGKGPASPLSSTMFRLSSERLVVSNRWCPRITVCMAWSCHPLPGSGDAKAYRRAQRHCSVRPLRRSPGPCLLFLDAPPQFLHFFTWLATVQAGLWDSGKGKGAEWSLFLSKKQGTQRKVVP